MNPFFNSERGAEGKVTITANGSLKQLWLCPNRHVLRCS